MNLILLDAADASKSTLTQTPPITSTHIFILILIIILSGVLGGVVNYYMNNVTKVWVWYDCGKSLILGLAASVAVPLFLRTVSSNLLTDSEKDPALYFVFCGFCLLGSIFSSKFLQSLSDRVLKELDEVKKETTENKAKVDAIVSQNSDDNQVAKISDPKLEVKAGADISKVVTALQSEKYTFRTIPGLISETNSNENDLKKVLQHLEDNDYVNPITRSDGVKLWALTPKGQKLEISK